jgi:hypothetical protein
MTGIAFCRNPSRAIESLKLGKLVLGISDRGWQDKSRKVRPVGRLGNACNSNHAPNIAKIRHNLPFFPGCCSSSVFDTLRRAR